MRHRILASAALLFSVLIPNPVMAANFSEIYVFGDSLSDTGQLFEQSQAQYPPSSLYFEGRFSNGPVWVEYLADELNIPFNPDTNFAYGGATTGEMNRNETPSRGLLDQVNRFQQNQDSADPNALYIVWAGPNDYLGNQESNPNQPVSNVSEAIATLAAMGAQNFLVPNLPDLGNLPATRNQQSSVQLNELIRLHNQGLAQSLQQLSSRLGSEVEIIPLNVNEIYNLVLDNPADFGFRNVTEPCLNQQRGMTCQNPQEYLFWDDIHPTTFAHEKLGVYAFQLLENSEAAIRPDMSSVKERVGVPTVGVEKRLKSRMPAQIGPN
ncbi:phospholipase/lecithinase/hemolysin [Oscillatoria acuminata PCC 6304]|uniref:Phospholipase/lecithinase/hemolysin n=2 Tax=Oscillatoria acuminata TaxID=118323 RepID=K9TJ96_9CYAN|nr:phospholipase/lecithinase/hemolysin [Oscillatoria acuminata PCC 6304]